MTAFHLNLSNACFTLVATLLVSSAAMAVSDKISTPDGYITAPRVQQVIAQQLNVRVGRTVLTERPPSLLRMAIFNVTEMTVEFVIANGRATVGPHKISCLLRYSERNSDGMAAVLRDCVPTHEAPEPFYIDRFALLGVKKDK